MEWEWNVSMSLSCLLFLNHWTSAPFLALKKIGKCTHKFSSLLSKKKKQNTNSLYHVNYNNFWFNFNKLCVQFFRLLFSIEIKNFESKQNEQRHESVFLYRFWLVEWLVSQWDVKIAFQSKHKHWIRVARCVVQKKLYTEYLHIKESRTALDYSKSTEQQLAHIMWANMSTALKRKEPYFFSVFGRTIIYIHIKIYVYFSLSVLLSTRCRLL